MCAYNYIYIRAVYIQAFSDRILLYWNFHDFSIYHVAIILNVYKFTAQQLTHIWQIKLCLSTTSPVFLSFKTKMYPNFIWL